MRSAPTISRLTLVCVLISVAIAGCDPPIALAEGTTVEIAIPLPALELPAGAPPPVVTIEAAGVLSELRLVVDTDNVARARVALNVADAKDVTFIVRVTGGIVDDGNDDDEATLLYAEQVLNLGPGSEGVIDAVEFVDEPAPGRLFLDVNRNGVSNRNDVARGCDPGVPEALVSLSSPVVQLNGGARDVVFVENITARPLTLRANVIDGEGFAVAFLDDGTSDVAVPAPAPIILESGALALVAIDFASATANRSDGIVIFDASDDVADDRCDVRLTRALRVVGNAGGPAAAAIQAAEPAPYAGDIDNVAALIADGGDHTVAVSVTAAPAAVGDAPKDGAFLVEIPAGGRLAASVFAAIDVDLHVFALAANDALGAEIPLHPGDTSVVPLAGTSVETADIIAAAHGGATADLRVLVVVGAPGTAEVRSFDDRVVVENGTVAAALRLRVTRTPRLVTAPVPDHGPATGGTDVVFTGDGLVGCDFFFGESEAVCSVGENDADGRASTSCVTGRSVVASGAVDVRAACDAGDIILRNAFSFDAVDPIVDELAPDQLDAAGGDVVTVSGFGFAEDSAVFVDDVAAFVDVVDVTTLRFVAPGHAVGAANVRIEAGGLSTLLAAALVYEDRGAVIPLDPRIVAVSPDPAHALFAGERLNVFGADLGGTTTAVVRAGAGSFTAVVEGATGSVVVVVVEQALPEGDLLLELGVAGTPLSFGFRAARPTPISLSADGPAAEGDPFTLLIDGSLLNPGRLIGARLTPLDAGSGPAVDITDPADFDATEDVVAITVDGLGRGGWQVTLLYEDDFAVDVDVIEVGGACPGAALCDQCGNGLRDPGEQCEGTDFGGQSCTSRGFDGGVLACVGCEIDANSCARCGNGIVEPGEQCDGANLGTGTCASVGFVTGALACDAGCNFDVVGCARCGDGVCSLSETSSSCAADCPVTCGDTVCQAAESCSICARDCSRCGPYQLFVVQGANQSGTITRALAEPVKVRVVDGDGAPVAGVVVSFSVIPGDVLSAATVSTNASGEALVSWQLGLQVGAHNLRASAVSPDGAVIDNQPADIAATAVDVAVGTLFTIAGTGVNGATLDPSGAGVRSQITQGISSTAITPDGDVWILETNNGRLLRVRQPNGVLEVVARLTGTGSGDGGPIGDATLHAFTAELAAGPDGSVYLLEPVAGATTRVRRLRPDGIIEAFAGGGPAQAGDGDGGPAVAAVLRDVRGISLARDGSLLVQQGGPLRRVANGVIDTVPMGFVNTIVGGRNLGQTGVTASIALSSRAIDVGGGAFAVFGNGFGILCSGRFNLCDVDECRCQNENFAGVSAQGPDGLLYGFQGNALTRTDGLGGFVVIAGNAADGAFIVSPDFIPAQNALFDVPRGLSVSSTGDVVLGERISARVRMIRGIARLPPPTPSLTVVQGADGNGPIFSRAATDLRVRLSAPVTVAAARVAFGSPDGGGGVIDDDVATDAGGVAGTGYFFGRRLGAQQVTVGLVGPARRMYPTVTATIPLSATALPVGGPVLMNPLPVNYGNVNRDSPLVHFPLPEEGFSKGPALDVDGVGAIAVASPGDEAVFTIDDNGRVGVTLGLINRGGAIAFGTPATASPMPDPCGVFFGDDGLYAVTGSGARIVRVNNNDGNVALVAGNGFGFNGANQPALDTGLDNFDRIVVDLTGNVLFSTLNPLGIARIDDGDVVRSVAPSANALCSPTAVTVRNGFGSFSALTRDGDRVLAAARVDGNATCGALTANLTHIFAIDDGVAEPVSLFSTSEFIRSLAIHPADGAAFMVVTANTNNIFTDHRLLEVDLDTDVVVDRTAELGATPWALSFSDDGILYVIDRVNGKLLAWRPR